MHTRIARHLLVAAVAALLVIPAIPAGVALADGTTTTTTLTSSANSMPFNTSITFTATVSPSPPDGETVTFSDEGTTLGSGSLNGGTATYQTSSLAPGTHTITATYGGDTTYAASTGTLSGGQVVGPTTTTLTSSANSMPFNTSITFTATVSPSPPDGETVTFSDEGTTLGSGSLNGGTATYQTSSLAPGTHTITATYGGDTTYAASTGTLSGGQVVGPTTTTLTSSANSMPFNTSITFTATVSPSPPDGETVTFSDEGTTLGSGSLNGGTATYQTSSLAPGTHTITATYGGDTTYAASTGTLSGGQVVESLTSSTAVASSANPSTVGQPVTFTATVTPSDATGTVTFNDGSTAICSDVPLNLPPVTCQATSLGVGNHAITAVYSGDTTYGPSTGTLSGGQAVNLKTQTITFNPPTSAVVGGTYTPTATGGGSTMPVIFSIESSSSGVCSYADGLVSFHAIGICFVDANQAGDANYQAAPQISRGITVAPPGSLPVLFVTPDPQSRPFGTANPAFTYLISGFINGQTLTTALVSGTPACTTTATLFSPAGTYPITCGVGTLTSPFYAFAFVPGTLTITHGASSVSLSTTTTVFETSTPVTWTAAVEPGVSGATPTGSVVFTIDGVARPAVPLDSSGHGSVTVTWPTTGVKNVSVSYSGDASYAAPGTASASPKVVANTARASGVGLSGTGIYPIVDGWLDTVSARGNRLEPLPVTITVKNAAGSAVRTFKVAAASGPYTWAWNGRTSSGSLVPSGVYTVVQTLTDPYGSRPRLVVTSKVTLSLRTVSWSTVTLTAKPGPRCFQFTSGDGVGAYACGSASGLALTGSAGHWPGVGYQFTLPTGIGYRSVRVELLGTFTGSRPAVGLHVWSLGTTWGQLYRPGWLRTSVSPSTTTWSGVTFTSPSGYISGRTVRVYVDGGGRLGGAFSFTVTGVRLIVSVGTLK